MGSPLVPTMANAFLVYFEKNWIQNCPPDFKPCYCRQYVDDIFVFFTSPKHLESFQNFVNLRHANMSSTTESEKQNRISFLEVQVTRKDKVSTTSVYRKSTFSEVYTHSDSFLPCPYKFVTVYTLAYKCFRICSSWTKLHTELFCLKEIFLKKWLP